MLGFRRSEGVAGPGQWSDCRSSFRRETLAKTGGRCAICGTTAGVEAHHVIGLREGGSNDAKTNGVPLCRKHHPEVEAARLRAVPFEAIGRARWMMSRA